MIRLDDSDAAVICKLVVVLKKIDMFSDQDDTEFWDDMEISLSRWADNGRTTEILHKRRS